MFTLILAALLLTLTPSPPATQKAIYQWFVDDGVRMHDLVRMSDLVVVGELRSVQEWTDSKKHRGRGVIDVGAVIWGSCAPGDTLVLEWDRFADPAIPPPRVRHSENAGKMLIWLLSRTERGSVRADHPGCIRLATERVRAWVEGELAAAPVMIWLHPGRYSKGAPARVTLGYRNFSDEAKEFPGLVFSDSVLYVAPEVSVMLRQGRAWVVNERPGHLVQAESVAPIRVEPMSEHGVSFDLASVFDLNGRNFLLTLEVEGCGESRTRSLNIK